jgi:cytoskeleton protein RodZ
MEDERGTFPTPTGDAEVGRVLEKTRKDKGLTLEEVERATKIRKRYLVGLEREDYRVLPDAVYARGFLKTYANYLGLDGEELSREFEDRRRPRRERGLSYGAPNRSEFDRPLINPSEVGADRRRRSISDTTLLTVLAAFLALAAVVGALYYVGRGVQISGENPAASQSSKDQGAQGSKPEGSRAPEVGGSEKDAGAGGSEPRPDSLTVAVSVGGSASWLSILVDGTLAYEQIAQPGFSQTFEAQRRISIRTGNAGAVGVEVNGQDLGKLGESGEVLTKKWTLKTAS